MAPGAAHRTVTAIVPVFNGAATLERCLGSLLLQSPALHEIFVIDDGSRDDSWSMIEAFARREPRLVIQRHQTNAGLARTLNEALGRAAGDAILILHQDSELVGADWVDRGLAALNARPRTCLSGQPLYPFPEFSAVETAFGVLRDTFYTPQGADEVLGFSEFKCDLLPRDAFPPERFDEGFRASGEDQVLSTRLAERGYSIVRIASLPYRQRFGNVSHVRSQLRKEVSYGRTEGGVLLRTAFRVTTQSTKSRTSKRRLVNRATAMLAPLAILCVVALFAAAGNPWLAASGLLLLLPRIALVVDRWRVLPRDTRSRASAGALAVALIPVNDVLYALALVVGFVTYAAVRRV